MVLLTLMAVVTIGVIRMKNLFGVVILSGIYSFLMASVLVVLDAVDVAMTEASVGAGVSMVLMLGALALTKTESTPSFYSPTIAFGLCAVVGAALIYASLGLPDFGSANTPMNTGVGTDFLKRSVPETGVINVVTSVLASYRGYDTLGETAVIFTAGIGVMLLLRGKRKTRYDDDVYGPGSAPDRDPSDDAEYKK